MHRLPIRIGKAGRNVLGVGIGFDAMLYRADTFCRTIAALTLGRLYHDPNKPRIAVDYFAGRAGWIRTTDLTVMVGPVPRPAGQSRTQPMPKSTVITVENKIGAKKKYTQAMMLPAAWLRNRDHVTSASASRSRAVLPPKYHVMTAEKIKNTETNQPKPR
jgi:hypothetical protein